MYEMYVATWHLTSMHIVYFILINFFCKICIVLKFRIFSLVELLKK